VRSYGETALHMAAYCGNRRIVGKLIASKAAVDAQNCHLCAFTLRHRRLERPSPRRLPCRETPLHYAARNGASDNIAELLLLRGAAVAVQNNNG
jgi:ankyrin repeat protein